MTLEEHCKLQKDVAERLRQKGFFSIKENLVYSVTRGGRTYHGEIDVMGRSPIDGTLHIYEIKSCPHKYRKACEQVRRYAASHPLEYVKGVFVSPTRVRRISCQQTQ